MKPFIPNRKFNDELAREVAAFRDAYAKHREATREFTSVVRTIQDRKKENARALLQGKPKPWNPEILEACEKDPYFATLCTNQSYRQRVAPTIAAIHDGIVKALHDEMKHAEKVEAEVKRIAGVNSGLVAGVKARLELLETEDPNENRILNPQGSYAGFVTL